MWQNLVELIKKMRKKTFFLFVSQLATTVRLARFVTIKRPSDAFWNGINLNRKIVQKKIKTKQKITKEKYNSTQGERERQREREGNSIEERLMINKEPRAKWRESFENGKEEKC